MVMKILIPLTNLPKALSVVVAFPLVFLSTIYYILTMTITQTIDIPADRRITVPHEVPTGPVIFTFTPEPAKKKSRMTEAEEIEHINRNADRLNAEAEDVLKYQVPLWENAE